MYHIGHSQGTMIGFAAYSKFPDVAQKVKMLIALAPVAKVGHIKGAFKLLAPFALDIGKKMKSSCIISPIFIQFYWLSNVQYSKSQRSFNVLVELISLDNFHNLFLK